MKRIHYLYFIVLAALASCTGHNKELTFVHMTDPQIGFLDESEHFRVSDSLLRSAVSSINRLKPRFVIVTGDLVHKWQDTEQRELFKAAIAGIDPSIKVYYTPGNHDLPDFSDEVLSGYDALVGYDRFCFTGGDCTFIGFDSCRIKYGTPEAEAEQYQWLESELGKASSSRHIFVFFHCPIAFREFDEEEGYDNFPKPLRRKYLDLFKKYGVQAMFTGHTHSGIETEFEGIKSYNAGPVAKAFNERGSGFNLVKVYPDSLSVTFTK